MYLGLTCPIINKCLTLNSLVTLNYFKIRHCPLLVTCPIINKSLSSMLVTFTADLHIFSSPPQQPMTTDFKGFSTPDFIHYIYFPILILEKEPVFPFLMFSAKQGHYWYHFYNGFGMTRSLTGDWTRDLPHAMPALYH